MFSVGKNLQGTAAMLDVPPCQTCISTEIYIHMSRGHIETTRAVTGFLGLLCVFSYVFSVQVEFS